MAIRPIIESPDPRLRQVAAPVNAFDASFAARLQDLVDTFRNEEGIGLAAPQIGEAMRALVMDLSEDRNCLQVFVNPVICEKSGFAMVEESCSSVPDVTGSVLRSARVRVMAQDAEGVEFEAQLDGMAAICLQHELDHLDGKLFIDRLPFWRRWRLHAA